jgi:hypothetical protein
MVAATPASSSNGRPAPSHPHARTSPSPNVLPTSLCRHLEATVAVSPWPALHGDHRSAASCRSRPAWPRSSPLRAPAAMKPPASKLPSPPPRPPPPPSAERRHNHHHHDVASTNHCRDGRPQPLPPKALAACSSQHRRLLQARHHHLVARHTAATGPARAPSCRGARRERRALAQTSFPASTNPS